MNKNFDEEDYLDRINSLLRAMKVLCVAVVVALVALVVFAAVSTATSLVSSNPEAFMIVSIVMGFILIALIIALVALLVAARINYSAYEKLGKKKPVKQDKKDGKKQ